MISLPIWWQRVLLTSEENVMISEVDIKDWIKLYDLYSGDKFTLTEGGADTPPASAPFTFSGVYTFEKLDGMYSRCFDSKGGLHHFAVWTKVVPWEEKE
jgi:hypothetical protein